MLLENQPGLGWLQGREARPVVRNEREAGTAWCLEETFQQSQLTVEGMGEALGDEEMSPSTIRSMSVRG